MGENVNNSNVFRLECVLKRWRRIGVIMVDT